MQLFLEEFCCNPKQKIRYNKSRSNKFSFYRNFPALNYLGHRGKEGDSKSRDHASSGNTTSQTSSTSLLKRKSLESSSESSKSSSSFIPEKKPALSIQLNTSKVSRKIGYNEMIINSRNH